MRGIQDKIDTNKKDKEGKESKEELEKFGCKISFIEGVESHASRNLINHNIDCKVGNRIVAIVNSCNVVVHAVTRHCGRTTSAQEKVFGMNNEVQFELHEVKFTCAIHSRS